MGKSLYEKVKVAEGLLDIITHYTQRFVLLNQFDSHTLQPGQETAGKYLPENGAGKAFLIGDN